MKTKPVTLIVIVATAFSVILMVQQQSSGQNKSLAASTPNPAIISKLEQIVAIRERQFKDYELQLQAGRAQIIDGSHETALAEARMRLAQEKNDDNVVVNELKKLVEALERRLKQVEDLARDRVAPGEVERVKVALLEAEIRLLKAQK